MGNPQGTLQTSEADLGWAAGIIDGEGTLAFSVYWRSTGYSGIRVRPQVIVCGTDKAIIDNLAGIYGRLGVGVYVYTRDNNSTHKARSSLARHSNYRPLHVANADGFKRAGKLLSIITPYLRSVKRQKGEMMLRYIKRRLEKSSEPRGGRLGGPTHDVGDLEAMLEIIRFSAANNGKGPGPKYLRQIEGHLRDLKQSESGVPA